MRLMHIHMGYEGGAERFFVTLAKALARRGHAQAALIRPGRSWAPELPGGMRVEESDYRRWWITRFTAQDKVRRLIRDFRPDGILAWMPRAAELLPASAPCPRVTRLGDYPNPKAYWKFRHTDTIVCNTPGIADWTRRHGWVGGLEVISNFSSLAPGISEPRARWGTPEDAFLVVAAGRLVRLKGFDVLIEAMRSLPGAFLWIVGDGEERPALEAQAAMAKVVDRVRFLGWQDELSPFLCAADVVCVPSRHEALGNAVLEGLAAGKAVVATATSGPAWILGDGVDGLLVPPGDAASLGAALACLRSNPALARQFAARGALTIAERFSEEVVTRAYLRLFGDCPPVPVSAG